MSAEPALTASTLFAFLLVLTRVGSAFVFVPIPGARNLPEAAKIVFAVALTIALLPLWPKVQAATVTGSQLLVWMAAEAAFGLTVGLLVAFLAEAFQLAAQMMGLQAGFSYASTVDPATLSDSTVLQSLAQLSAGMIFFAAGLHRDVLRVFAASLDAWPPGSFTIAQPLYENVRQLSGVMFTAGLRLALPVLALLLLVDVALALLGRINAQLQLLSLAFPIKILGTVATLAVLLTVFPLVFERTARQTLNALAGLVR
jgi:flagellar biosynthetic protein FliR